MHPHKRAITEVLTPSKVEKKSCFSKSFFKPSNLICVTETLHPKRTTETASTERSVHFSLACKRNAVL